MKKITLTEFWNSKQNLAIHCDTEEKANKLLMAFDKLDKRWSNDHKYTSFNNYEVFEDKTCYSNRRAFWHYEGYSNFGYTIYEFEDVDLEN